MLTILALIAASVATFAAGAIVPAVALAALALLLLAGPATARPVQVWADETGDVSTFIPEFWIRELLRKLRTSLVYGQPNVVNRNYQGTISGAGDTVKVNSIGEVTIKDYVRNAAIDSPEELTTTLTTLLITEEKYFNFAVDDVDAAQAAGNVLGGGMESAAFGLRDVADKFIASHYTDVDAANLIGDDAAPTLIDTAEKAYDNLVDLGVLLDEADIPTEGRFAVIPPWYHGLVRKDDRFVATGDAASTRARLNGEVGEAGGFTLSKSNNTPIGDPAGPNENYKVITGVPLAFSYAEQVNKTVAYEPDDRFADAIKGLHVYGGKLFYPTGWAVLSAKR